MIWSKWCVRMQDDNNILIRFIWMCVCLEDFRGQLSLCEVHLKNRCFTGSVVNDWSRTCFRRGLSFRKRKINLLDRLRPGSSTENSSYSGFGLSFRRSPGVLRHTSNVSRVDRWSCQDVSVTDRQLADQRKSQLRLMAFAPDQHDYRENSSITSSVITGRRYENNWRISILIRDTSAIDREKRFVFNFHLDKKCSW